MSTPERWLSCKEDTCPTSTCPKIVMDRIVPYNNDWTKCEEVVFQIFRKSGTGPIQAGETVGLIRTDVNLWLNCDKFSMQCKLTNCNGQAVSGTDFATNEACPTLKIYAHGKAHGPLDTSDRVMQYVATKWIGLNSNGDTVLQTCPGTKTPPSNYRYDDCKGEIFQIWKEP